jgi:tRNA (guanine37-N1)-methyltransferase
MKEHKIWHVHILTLFPEIFPGFLGHSLTGKSLNKYWSYEAINLRDFATDTHKTVDDVPFGGGAGMVIKPDIIEKATLSLPQKTRRIYLSPRGKPLTQNIVQELSQEDGLTLLCGRYEGVDQRAVDVLGYEEMSIGDYVLTGGEQAAMILMDSCIRLLEGVLGNQETIKDESFSRGLLEYPHYTRPALWTDKYGQMHAVPDILTSGHHAKIEQWRKEQSEHITQKNRPDLWTIYSETINE